MLKRCRDRNHRSYHRYGGSGVRVCARWLRFENFLADMGPRPRGSTLDRWPDRKGNYEPGNCRWAGTREQAFNKSCTILSLDRRLILARKAEHLGNKSAAARWAVTKFGCAYRSAFNVLMPKKMAADARLRQRLNIIN